MAYQLGDEERTRITALEYALRAIDLGIMIEPQEGIDKTRADRVLEAAAKFEKFIVKGASDVGG